MWDGYNDRRRDEPHPDPRHWESHTVVIDGEWIALTGARRRFLCSSLLRPTRPLHDEQQRVDLRRRRAGACAFPLPLVQRQQAGGHLCGPLGPLPLDSRRSRRPGRSRFSMRFLVEYFGLFTSDSCCSSGGSWPFRKSAPPKHRPERWAGSSWRSSSSWGVHVVLQRRLAVGIENAVPHPGIGLPAAMKEPLVSSPPPSPPRA